MVSQWKFLYPWKWSERNKNGGRHNRVTQHGTTTGATVEKKKGLVDIEWFCKVWTSMIIKIDLFWDIHVLLKFLTIFPLGKEFAFLVMGKSSNMIGTSFFVFRYNIGPGTYLTTKDWKHLNRINWLHSLLVCSFSALTEIIWIHKRTQFIFYM